MKRSTKHPFFGLLILAAISIACGYWAFKIAADISYHYHAWGISWSLLIRGGWLVVFFSILAVASGWAPLYALWMIVRSRIARSRDS